MAQDVHAYQVIVSGRLVAHLFNRGQAIWLDWQDGYWNDPRRPVLGQWFDNDPGRRISSTRDLPAWFGNLLPEGHLRRWVTADAGASGELPLLVRLGHDLPGAVQVVATADPIDPSWDPKHHVVPERPRDVTASGLRFSLAGVALKFSMVQDGKRLVIPAHDEDGDWIVKMPDSVFSWLPLNEFAMMTMAGAVGIKVPEIRLVHRDQIPEPGDAAWPGGQEWAYAIRRFDRHNGTRIHMEDMAQVLGRSAGDEKYRGSHETVANILNRVDGREAVHEFVRRSFYSAAIGNGDMHLKNISLIYPDGRRPRLSPAYDLVSTAPYGIGGADELALTLARSKQLARVSPRSFMSMAQRIEVSPEDVRETAREVARLLPDAWAQVEDTLAALPTHRAWLAERIPNVARSFA